MRVGYLEVPCCVVVRGAEKSLVLRKIRSAREAKDTSRRFGAADSEGNGVAAVGKCRPERGGVSVVKVWLQRKTRNRGGFAGCGRLSRRGPRRDTMG